MKFRVDKRLLFFFSYRGACRVLALLLFGLVFIFSEPVAQAQANATNSLGFNLQLPDDPKEFDLSIRIVIFFTLLAIAPSLMIMMTCFTRIVIVMSFLRTALALQQAPSNQLLVSFSLFLTFFIMGPVFEDINSTALTPYSEGEITSQEAIEIGAGSGFISKVLVEKMKLGEADSSGRKKPEPISNSDFEINADIAIKALGFDPEDLPYLFNEPNLAVSKWGTIKINLKSMETNIPGVFAAGDIVRGASLVVWAIRDGREAASSIQKYLQNEELNKTKVA